MRKFMLFFRLDQIYDTESKITPNDFKEILKDLREFASINGIHLFFGGIILKSEIDTVAKRIVSDLGEFFFFFENSNTQNYASVVENNKLRIAAQDKIFDIPDVTDIKDETTWNEIPTKNSAFYSLTVYPPKTDYLPVLEKCHTALKIDKKNIWLIDNDTSVLQEAVQANFSTLETNRIFYNNPSTTKRRSITERHKLADAIKTKLEEQIYSPTLSAKLKINETTLLLNGGDLFKQKGRGQPDTKTSTVTNITNFCCCKVQ